MPTYAVLTGDIVKSRDIAPRAQLLATLKEALATAGENHQGEYKEDDQFLCHLGEV